MKPWERHAGFAFVVAAWIGLAWIGWQVYSPPAPRPADIPDNEFSAERARVILKELVGRGIPHPAGSQENAVVRERILNDLRSVGYDPQVQETHTIPGRSALVNRPVVRNIVARRRGRQPGPAILLAGHYDSVDRGPGASDDGVAVAAILEIARMLQALPATRNDVIFLITDGEERGLVGAHGFVREHPWAKDVKVAINLEARGTSGPSLMFQTSDDDKWLISLFARHVSRPTTSSLYAEIYKRLPNDTDFTVFKGHGIEGYNFAFVRYEQNYHTKNDNFANADPGSLQHHGQNAWQLLTALAETDLAQRSPGRAIYCDVLAMFVVWWPASINFGLAVGILAITLAAGLIARRRRLFSRFKGRIFLSVAAPLFAGALAVWWIGIRGTFVDIPLRPIAAFWLVALLAVFVAARYTPLGNIEMWSAWVGVWLFWDTVGLVAAWFVPGASYLFLLPGAIAAIGGLIAACLPTRKASRVFLGVCCLGPVAVGVLWLPIQVLFSDAVGLTLAPVYPLCASLVTITALPLLAREISPTIPQVAVKPPS
jgi:Peptidase family M28